MVRESGEKCPALLPLFPGQLNRGSRRVSRPLRRQREGLLQFQNHRIMKLLHPPAHGNAAEKQNGQQDDAQYKSFQVFSSLEM